MLRQQLHEIHGECHIYSSGPAVTSSLVIWIHILRRLVVLHFFFVPLPVGFSLLGKRLSATAVPSRRDVSHQPRNTRVLQEPRAKDALTSFVVGSARFQR